MEFDKPLVKIMTFVGLGLALGLATFYLLPPPLSTAAPPAPAKVVAHPPDTFEASYEYLPLEQMIKTADLITLGRVTALGPTQWNQESGAYWAETFTHEGDETAVTALPYYQVEIAVQEVWADEVGLTEPQLTVTVVEMRARAGADTLNVGDELLLFMRAGEIAWRSDEIQYDAQTGFLEVGRQPALLFVGDPAYSFVRRTAEGGYRYTDGYTGEESSFPAATWRERVQEVRGGG